MNSDHTDRYYILLLRSPGCQTINTTDLELKLFRFVQEPREEFDYSLFNSYLRIYDPFFFLVEKHVFMILHNETSHIFYIENYAVEDS